VRQFKLSNDPQFAAKLHEIVGLYVDPPDHAIVLSVDEKSQIQALDRTQPGLPMKRGRVGTMNPRLNKLAMASTTLFAGGGVGVRDVLEGQWLLGSGGGGEGGGWRHEAAIRTLQEFSCSLS
jgi:hypothetical protein